MPTLQDEVVVLGSWAGLACSQWSCVEFTVYCGYSCCCLTLCHYTHAFETNLCCWHSAAQ